MASFATFKAEYFNPQADVSWSSWGGRVSRYGVYRGLYDSTVYEDIHRFAHTLKWSYGLYEGVRSLGSPTFLIASTFKDNIWHGVLDKEALDTGAIPVFTEIEPLRPFIADIWKWSQWGRKKSLLTLTGTVAGDVGLEVIDEIDRVYLKIIQPELVKDVIIDSFGNTKGYTLEFTRNHPERENQAVTYTKIVSKDGDNIKFETLLNDKPYAWPENVNYAGEPVSTWTEAYGFVPFVWFRHIDNGSNYGESEYQAGLSRFREIDEMASRLGDQVRKSVDPIWVAKGVKPDDISFPKTTANRPRPEGEEMKLLCLSSDKADIEPMVADLNIADTLQHIEKLTGFLEETYPEITISRLRTEGNVISGRALRMAQRPVESRIIERRAGYDSGLVSGLQMALSIGGYRNIYPGITLESYERGRLEFEVSDRPVFVIDEVDKSEIEKEFFEAAKVAVEAGIPIKNYLLYRGLTEEEASALTLGAILKPVE